MKKEEFLSVLKDKLKESKINDTNDIIEYYDEMISEKIESGEKENKIIKDVFGF